MSKKGPNGFKAERMARLRRAWGISQSQLAGLLVTSARTIRRWEQTQLQPTEHIQWRLSLFIDYVRRNSVRALLRRFIGHGGRLSAVGRPKREI